jgi:hypothetical protein
VPRFTDDIEARAKNAHKRNSRDLFDIKSTAVFPYLLEPDNTMGFPFSVEVTIPLIKLFHSAPGVGHRGAKAVHDIISTSYVWKNMRAEINNVIAVCLTCQQTRQHHVPDLGIAGTIPVPYQPREVIHLDHITKMPPDDEGYDEILAIKDRFSKQVLLEPAKSTDLAQTTWDRLLFALDRTGGLPDVIITDNGTKFQGDFMVSATKYGISVIKTSKYHPNSNGEVERSHALTKRYLMLYTQQSHHWTANLPACERSQNSSINSTTGFTPDDVVFFHPVVSPYDPPAVRQARRRARWLASTSVHGRSLESSDSSHEAKEHIWKTVRKKLIEAAKKHAATYDARHTQKEFQVGDYVWVRSTIRQHHGLKALRPNWLGPYQIAAKRSPQLYQISPAPDQPTILDREWLNVDKLWPAALPDEGITWMPMDEDMDPNLKRPDFSSPLSRFSNLLKNNVD